MKSRFIPINFIVFKVPPVQFWSPWPLEALGLVYTKLTLCEGVMPYVLPQLFGFDIEINAQISCILL